MAERFVRVRLMRITGVDLRLFDFDYDLTWYAFVLTPDERVLGRYGGRDARDPDARLSLAGLRYALNAALEAHRRAPKDAPPRRAGSPLRAEDLPAAKRLRPGECIHCHQVNEFRREAQKAAGTWSRDDRWVYPLPENVGLTLEVARGNRVGAIAVGSPAAKAGLRVGDLIETLNARPIASFADAQYALHHAPAKGRVAITWQRDGKRHSAALELAAGWRMTNLTWRPSLLDVLPSLPLYGVDLSAAEKRALGLPEKRLAFRQQTNVPKDARAAGVRAGDVILGFDSQAPAMTLAQFLAHVRRNYLVGDRVTLNVLRAGKRLDLPLTLR